MICLVLNFRGVFDAGGADYWYTKQQKLFPGLLLSPPPSPRYRERPLLLQWSLTHCVGEHLLSEANGAVTILHENSKPLEYPPNNSVVSLPYPEGFNERYLSVPQRNFYLDPRMSLITRPRSRILRN